MNELPEIKHNHLTLEWAKKGCCTIEYRARCLKCWSMSQPFKLDGSQRAAWFEAPEVKVFEGHKCEFAIPTMNIEFEQRTFTLESKDRFVKTEAGFRVNPLGASYRIKCQCGVASDAFKFPEVKLADSLEWKSITPESSAGPEWHRLPVAHQFMREHTCKSD